MSGRADETDGARGAGADSLVVIEELRDRRVMGGTDETGSAAHGFAVRRLWRSHNPTARRPRARWSRSQM